jgi:hypothetical protein
LGSSPLDLFGHHFTPSQLTAKRHNPEAGSKAVSFRAHGLARVQDKRHWDRLSLRTRKHDSANSPKTDSEQLGGFQSLIAAHQYE